MIESSRKCWVNNATMCSPLNFYACYLFHELSQVTKQVLLSCDHLSCDHFNQSCSKTSFVTWVHDSINLFTKTVGIYISCETPNISIWCFSKCLMKTLTIYHFRQALTLRHLNTCSTAIQFALTVANIVKRLLHFPFMKCFFDLLCVQCK